MLKAVERKSCFVCVSVQSTVSTSRGKMSLSFHLLFLTEWGDVACTVNIKKHDAALALSHPSG